MHTHLHLTEATQGPGEPQRAPHPTQVVLVDGHAAVRRSLRRLLATEDDLVLIVEAADLTTAMRLVRDRSPDVLVLDLPLPEGSSIEAIREIRAQVPNTAIIVLTMEASPLFAQRVIDAGAVGFVLKDKADTELAAAIRRAARGHEYVSSHVAVALDALLRARTPPDR